MKANLVGKSAPELARQRPLFGQLVGVAPDRLESCLAQQRRQGGRLGEILRAEGLLPREAVSQVLRDQARWVARELRNGGATELFPHPAFLSLCMPAYNEADNIEDTLQAACAILPEFVQHYEVVVVDDGSRDGTGDLVARFAQREPAVRLVSHERNRGYGAALTSGLRAARGELVLFTDSDGQFSFLDVPQLLARLDGHDVVIGYRHRRAEGLLRRCNAAAWNWLIRLYLGVRVRDLDCAYKLFRRAVIDRLQLTADGAAISAEIMAQVAALGCRVCQTPVMHYPRSHGSPTGARFKVIVKAFRELPLLWKYRVAAAQLGQGTGAKDQASGSGAKPVVARSEYPVLSTQYSVPSTPY